MEPAQARTVLRCDGVLQPLVGSCSLALDLDRSQLCDDPDADEAPDPGLKGTIRVSGL